MPNWVYHKVVVRGDEAKVDEFFEKMFTEGERVPASSTEPTYDFDFRNIIPRPEVLEGTSSPGPDVLTALMHHAGVSTTPYGVLLAKETASNGSEKKSCVELLPHIIEKARNPISDLERFAASVVARYLDNGRQLSTWEAALFEGVKFATKRMHSDIVDQRVFNPFRVPNIGNYIAFVETGFDNWYDFNTGMWGCKWNASDTIYTRQPGELTFSFNTPWSNPYPIMHEIFREFTDLHFEWDYLEEGPHFAGTVISEAGPVGEDEDAWSEWEADIHDKDEMSALMERVHGYVPEWFYEEYDEEEEE